ncbi:Mov34/MPN/PAD-1 family protein [Amycolatopsis magusensis]|uniref:Mov34/MPN/PAD-1 family protein n=1 Tax=Amycolatopsis magusensis TaxID=882444 RepID=UPI0024A9B0C0|nr:Mov34/MPN/PAD-1 family protein [Amycolatopsis magusensis]MDI5975478.1 Mov34/MPN/PAD-1 family protein [Amycolatopsis magusensis]
MRSLAQVLEVAPEVLAVIAKAADAAHPCETGGLLLGWWDGGRIVVRHAIEVPDPEATPTSWVRVENTAQAALDEALDRHPHPWLGYVGDWHSHPAACGASSQDITSIQRASGQYEQPLVLLVHRADDLVEAVVTDSAKHTLMHGTLSETPEKESS